MARRRCFRSGIGTVCVAGREEKASHAKINPQYINIGGEITMKKAVIVIGAVCVCGIAVLAGSAEAREKLFNGKYEDTYLKIVDIGRLLGDLLAWPYHFIRALLP